MVSEPLTRISTIFFLLQPVRANPAANVIIPPRRSADSLVRPMGELWEERADEAVRAPGLIHELVAERHCIGTVISTARTLRLRRPSGPLPRGSIRCRLLLHPLA